MMTLNKVIWFFLCTFVSGYQDATVEEEGEFDEDDAAEQYTVPGPMKVEFRFNDYGDGEYVIQVSVTWYCILSAIIICLIVMNVFCLWYSLKDFCCKSNKNQYSSVKNVGSSDEDQTD